MPVQSCRDGGKPGYRWGESGKCYVYTPNNEASRKAARAKAARQGRAIQVNKDSIDKADSSGKVQALIFSKPKFTKALAIAWAKSHGFKYNTSRDTENTIRLRQFPPNDCSREGGMKELYDGVQAYICPISSDKSVDNLSHLSYIKAQSNDSEL